MPDRPRSRTSSGSGASRLAAGALLLAVAAVSHAACEGKVCPLDDGWRAFGARSVAFVLPAAHASEKPDEGAAAPASAAQAKRSAVFMTAVSEDGQVYSPDHGPLVFPREARYALLALFVAGLALLYLLLTGSDRSRLSAAAGLAIPALPPDPPVRSSAPEIPAVADLPSAPAAVERSSPPSPQEPSWAALVRLCGGDAVRAATVIAGETAADPSLSADSPEALARAIARFKK